MSYNKEYAKKYRKEHKEEIKKYVKIYGKNYREMPGNCENARWASVCWREQNKEHIKEYNKKYWSINKNKINEQRKVQKARTKAQLNIKHKYSDKHSLTILLHKITLVLNNRKAYKGVCTICYVYSVSGTVRQLAQTNSPKFSTHRVGLQ